MSSSLSSLPLGVDLSSSLDGLYYGYVVSTALFGITLVQGWVYMNINSDSWPLRIFVSFLICLDFANTALSSQILHHYLVANFGNLVVVQTISIEMRMEALMTMFLAVAGQIFFAVYIYRLRRCHKLVPAVIAVVGLGGFGVGIASVVQLFKNDSITGLTDLTEKVELGSASGLATLADIISTIAIIWSTSSSRTGIKTLDSSVEKIYQLAVTQGVFVTLDQLMVLILLLVTPRQLYWMPFHLCLGKAYVITMIAILNARDSAQANVHPRSDVSHVFVAAPGVGSITGVNGVVDRDGNDSMNQYQFPVRAPKRVISDDSNLKVDDYELQDQLKATPAPVGAPTKIYVSRDRVVS